MIDTIFKKNDRVYCHIYGWGTISGICKGFYPIDVEFDSNIINSYTKDGRITEGANPSLSFTEYKLDGFSQERPENLPHKGNIVWVRDGKIFNWEVYHFIKHEPNDEFPYIVSNDCDINNSIAFKYLTTLNPYINEHR